MLTAKPGGGVRIYQNYRGLNNITIKNRYPFPLIRETLDALVNAKFYTKLDIIAVFNNLHITEKHKWKTAFITKFGLFESLVMPFGLCNTPTSFQHYINHTLFDLLDKFCTAYLDNILIYSTIQEEHKAHIKQVIIKLRNTGLQIDINKCEFETTRTKYLDLIIGTNGVSMDPEKIKAITTWLPPQFVRDLQKFLGFANFYRQFIQGFSQFCQPLHNLLKKNTIWNWTPIYQHAFENLKIAFVNTPVLAYFDFSKKSILEINTSDWASKEILSQVSDNGLLQPIAYFSSKHSTTECNYEIYNKELLTIIKYLEEWKLKLQGTKNPFDIITNHKNLKYFTTTKSLSQHQIQ